MRYSKTMILLAAAGLAGLASVAHGQELGPVMITEIMYNPHGVDEGQEWVEIYNTSNSVVDISRWALEDDDGETAEFPSGTTLAPHAVAVIVPVLGGVSGNGSSRKSTYVNSPAAFDAAWGPGVQIIWVESFWNYPGNASPITGTINGLSNEPSPTNELLRLINRQKEIIDQVDYDDDQGTVTPWPDDNDGGSIQLLRDFATGVTANNIGAAWRLSGPGDGLSSWLASTALPAYPGLASYGTPGVLPNVLFSDCNANGINDAVDIVSGAAADSYPYNNLPDSCEGDCNSDGLPDLTQIALEWRTDRNANGTLDACEINAAGGVGGFGGSKDTNVNGILDSFEQKPKVIITEILYNPAGDDEGKEFVEIYNTSATSVDISGWKLKDLEGDPATGAIPAGTILAAHQALVLMPGSGPGVPADIESQFRSAWNLSSSARTIALSPWQDRAQQATHIEEVLALIDASGEPVDVVDYENPDYVAGSEWPSDDGVSSIVLKPGAMNGDANDLPSNWERAMANIDGARDSVQTGFFSDLRLTGSTGSPALVWIDPHEQPTGEMLISEIMYNPNSSSANGSRNEWLEVFNPGPASVDISGWYLRDEDGRTGTVPSGTLVLANSALVLVPVGDASSPDEASQDFRAAWGDLCQVVAVTGWSDQETVPNIGNLSNSPAPGNEILTLRRANGTVVDVVNFDDDGFVWPADAPPAPPGLGTAWSIYLLPGHYTAAANNDGLNWGASIQGIDLADLNVTTLVFNGFDIGSPARIAGITPPTCGCPADVDGTGFVDTEDFDAYVRAFEAGTPNADFDGSGFVDTEDFDAFVRAFEAGC